MPLYDKISYIVGLVFTIVMIAMLVKIAFVFPITIIYAAGLVSLVHHYAKAISKYWNDERAWKKYNEA